MNVTTEMNVKLRVLDAKTRKVVSETPWQKNLVMDGGLNALAQSTNPCNPTSFFAACRVGSGSAANSAASGAITFTQVTTTLTASAPFFSAGMVGQLFKYGSGTGGAEMYITAFTSSTIVTVGTSATVSTPTVGTVWNVTQAALGALLYSSNTYETTAGSCSTAVSGGVATHKRTFNFALQGSPYTVNEVGYFTTTTGTTIFGRLVLGASVVVNPTNFLQVVLSFTVTYSPAAPTAVSNIGVTINTAGNAMLENLVSATGARIIAEIGSSGGATAATSGCIDASFGTSTNIRGITANYTQNSATLQTNTPSITQITFQDNISWTYNSVRGQMIISANTTITTAGQSLYGVCLFNASSGVGFFDVKFTTPYVTPTGSFLPQVSFTVTYDRNLSN